MIDKFDPGTENRTFASRLEFIAGIFAHPYTKTEILASSVQFKLNKTYEQYLADITRSFEYLKNKESEKVITKIKEL